MEAAMGPFEKDTTGRLLVVQQANGRIRAILPGALDLTNTETTRDQLRAVMSRFRPRTLILDMTAVDFCDCASLQMLIDVHADGERQGTRVVIRGASPVMAWLLRLFELDDLFDYPATGPARDESSG
jgi:anti-anti-sigma factor